VRQIETQAELASGCGQSWKDLFKLEANDLHPSASGPVFKGHPAAVTVCVFHDVPGSTGKFLRGGAVNGAAATTLVHSISAGRRFTGCAKSHAMFAVLWPMATGQAGPTAYVELGGCERVLRIDYIIHRSQMVALEHDEIGQASSAAIRVIEHVGTQHG
jgi:hypothetical protein